jgi:ParB family chromosome partitioning protein
MAKTAFEAPRSNVFMLLPEELTIVEDKAHWLYDPRVDVPPDEGFIRDIEQRGIVQPIVVVKEDGKTLVVVGRRRTRAAQIINEKRKGQEPIRVPCWIRKGDEAALYEVACAENVHRRNDNVAETVEKATRLMNLTGDRKRAAAALGRTPAQIQQLLNVNELHKDVRRALYANKIGLVAALQFHGLPLPEQAAALQKLLEEAGEQSSPAAVGSLPSPTAAGDASSPKARKRPAVSGKKVQASLGKQSGVRGLKEIEERLAVRTLPPDYRAALLWVLYRDTKDASAPVTKPFEARG